MKIYRQESIQRYVSLKRQSGVSLFVALIALVALMLASIGLIRSVDTSTVIAGNLAFKQSATVAGDRGVETARVALTTLQNSNLTQTPSDFANHPLNLDDKANGYHASLDPTLDLYLPPTSPNSPWVDAPQSSVQSQKIANGAVDAGGNSSRYIIQRMCRTAAVQINDKSNCLFNFSSGSKNEMSNQLQPETQVSNVLYRVTVRITGPRNTVSYIQAFIF